MGGVTSEIELDEQLDASTRGVDSVQPDFDQRSDPDHGVDSGCVTGVG